MKRFVVPFVLTEDEFSELNKKAENGDAQAQFQVAVASSQPLWNGLWEEYNADTENDRKKYLDDAAAQKHLDACYLRSQFNAETYSGEDEEKYKRTLLEIAANKGLAIAQLKLGQEYVIDGNDKEALLPLEQALNNGIYEASEDMAALYLRAGDDSNALKMLDIAVEHKTSYALFWLGIAYLNGELGLERNIQKGLELLNESAELGNTDAMVKLADLYGFDNDYGIEHDESIFIKWVKQGAALGNVTCFYYLGMAYHYGLGVVPDSLEAMNYYKKADNEGNLQAKLQIGLLYANGTGMADTDYIAATAWLQAAIDAGLEGEDKEKAERMKNEMTGKNNGN